MGKKQEKQRYMLIDGHALIHRGFHALPGLTDKAGKPTGAIYGFTMILLRAIKELKPTHIACTFDLPKPTFRHEKYADYKAQRESEPSELTAQVPVIKEIVQALNIPIFEKAGFEADDLLGSLAVKIKSKELQTAKAGPDTHDLEIMIVTGDLDTLQLVNDCVKIYTLRKGITDITVYDEEKIKERYGLTPLQMIDYKALRGDPSDNIKGVKGIGEKTAQELIQEFGSISSLYEQIRNPKSEILNKIKPRVLQLLIDGEEAARQSYDLSRIRTDVRVKADVPPYEFGEKQNAKIFELFRTLEFRSLLDKLPKGYETSKGKELRVKSQDLKELKITPSDFIPHSSPLNPHSSSIGKQDYQLIDTEEKLSNLLTLLAKQTEFVLDTESTSLDVMTAQLVGISLCFELGVAFYIPAELVLPSPELKEILENPEIAKCGHNIKYDAHVLKNAGFDLQGIKLDTMLLAYLLNAGSRQYSLDALAFNELGYQMQPITELIGSGKAQMTMDMVPVEKVSWYACEDADITFRLKNLFLPELEKAGLLKLAKTVELPLVEVLFAMERCGIKVDVKLLRDLSLETQKQISFLEEEIYRLSGETFNINSPKQLKEVLFGVLGLSSYGNKKTKTGLSTAAGELEKLVGHHPVIEKILDFREVTKLQNTYLEALPELINKSTQRIHTNYNQTIAATGRLSSTDPNLQNIPVSTGGISAQVRQAFVADKGWKLVSVDYSQMELRIAAHLSGDDKMREIFAHGGDIHTATAMGLFGVTAEKVTKEMRKSAKTVNFGILYGLSAFGLSDRVGQIAQVEAKEYIARYFDTYPGIKAYIDKIKKEVAENGFIKNELGRMRKFPEIKSSQFFIRQAAERAAVNFPIQSLQADIIKIAMINIHRELSTKQLVPSTECRMLLQVHDELVFEVREDLVGFYVDIIKSLMVNAYKLTVPIEVTAKVGDNWGEMTEI